MKKATYTVKRRFVGGKIDCVITHCEMEEQNIQRLYRQGMKDVVW